MARSGHARSAHSSPPTRDPTGPSSGSARVMRGGSYRVTRATAGGTEWTHETATTPTAPPDTLAPRRHAWTAWRTRSVGAPRNTPRHCAGESTLREASCRAQRRARMGRVLSPVGVDRNWMWSASARRGTSQGVPPMECPEHPLRRSPGTAAATAAHRVRLLLDNNLSPTLPALLAEPLRTMYTSAHSARPEHPARRSCKQRLTTTGPLCEPIPTSARHWHAAAPRGRR